MYYFFFFIMLALFMSYRFLKGEKQYPTKTKSNHFSNARQRYFLVSFFGQGSFLGRRGLWPERFLSQNSQIRAGTLLAVN
jgi:hypothetical protein